MSLAKLVKKRVSQSVSLWRNNRLSQILHKRLAQPKGGRGGYDVFLYSYIKLKLFPWLCRLVDKWCSCQLWTCFPTAAFRLYSLVCDTQHAPTLIHKNPKSKLDFILPEIDARLDFQILQNNISSVQRGVVAFVVTGSLATHTLLGWIRFGSQHSLSLHPTVSSPIKQLRLRCMVC